MFNCDLYSVQREIFFFYIHVIISITILINNIVRNVRRWNWTEKGKKRSYALFFSLIFNLQSVCYYIIHLTTVYLQYYARRLKNKYRSRLRYRSFNLYGIQIIFVILGGLNFYLLLFGHFRLLLGRRCGWENILNIFSVELLKLINCIVVNIKLLQCFKLKNLVFCFLTNWKIYKFSNLQIDKFISF